jgi:hypothetical protein
MYRSKTPSLLDHLVGRGKQSGWYFEGRAPFAVFKLITSSEAELLNIISRDHHIALPC